MAQWSVQTAKARFSEMLETCMTDGPQTVTKRGIQAAVLVPMAEWRRLQQTASPSLKQLLLSPSARCDLTQPRRGKLQRRPPASLA